MSKKVAFIGLRHGHVKGLYKLLQERGGAVAVAACEEDAGTRESLVDSGIAITHNSYEAMLTDADCDIVACGDYYAVRGERLEKALEAGKHVIADKPLCTSLTELDRIETLAREKDLRVGCMLALCDAAPIQTLRRLLREGALGEVHTIHFDGKHPLNYGHRPAWYFEEGKHGGTLNDIAIHAIDAIPWITGIDLAEVTAARAWNARLKECPFFQDAAVCMLLMENGGAVTGDVSYLAPEGQGFTMPSYWRFSMAGSEGYAETSATSDAVRLFRKGATEGETIALDPARPGGYWDDFLADIDGQPNEQGLNTARVLLSARRTLEVQAAADSGTFPRPLAG